MCLASISKYFSMLCPCWWMIHKLTLYKIEEGFWGNISSSWGSLLCNYGWIYSTLCKSSSSSFSNAIFSLLKDTFIYQIIQPHCNHDATLCLWHKFNLDTTWNLEAICKWHNFNSIFDLILYLDITRSLIIRYHWLHSDLSPKYNIYIYIRKV